MKFPTGAYDFVVPLYGGSVWLYTKRQRMQRAQDFFKPGYAIGLCAGHTIAYQGQSTGEMQYLVGVFDGLQRTLVHESAHVAFMICRTVGINPNDGDEPYCYLLDYIYAALTEHI